MNTQQGGRRVWRGVWRWLWVGALLVGLALGLLWRARGPVSAVVAVPANRPAASGAPALEGEPPGVPVPAEVRQAQQRPTGTGTGTDAQAVGNLRAHQSVVLRSACEGRIVRLGFQDGQRVFKGQLLVQLDSSLLGVNLQRAEARAREASGQLQRARAVVAQFGGPAADPQKHQAFLAALQAMDDAQAASDVAAAEVNRARDLLKRQRVLAPFEGVAHLGPVSVGEPVGEGAELLSLEDRRTLWVDVRFRPDEAPQLRAGQILPLNVDALPGQPFEVRVQAIEDQRDASGKVRLVHTQVLHPVPAMRPGLVARVGLDPQGAQPPATPSAPATTPRG